MSPDKRDLDAELAALEAELAALESRKKAPKKEAPAAPATPEAPKEKRGFGFGRKPSKPEPAAPASAAPPQAPAPVAPSVLAAPAVPRTDAALWRQAGSEWVRTVPRQKPVVRRIMDENEQVVREEPAAAREVESVEAVKAERGVGRLFRRKKDG